MEVHEHTSPIQIQKVIFVKVTLTELNVYIIQFLRAAAESEQCDLI